MLDEPRLTGVERIDLELMSVYCEARNLTLTPAEVFAYYNRLLIKQGLSTSADSNSPP